MFKNEKDYFSRHCKRSAEKAVVYDAAKNGTRLNLCVSFSVHTAGIARTFCGMFTVGIKASPERGGGTKCRRG